MTPQEPARRSAGRIDVICGCMFVGKTARLIERLRAVRDAGRRVVAFKHTLDVRYARDALATHDGLRFPASLLVNADEIPPRAGGAEVIGIDEAQFFGRRLVAVCEALRARGGQVIVAGIDYDAWGQPFPPLPSLKDIADSVEVMRASCRVCGEPAPFSQRMTPVVDGEMVGGPEDYEPRCARCFVPLPDPAPVY
jgi:thymidine kinase